MSHPRPVPLHGTRSPSTSSAASASSAADRLRRTPVHRDVLASVISGRVAWRTTVGPSGGFVHADGMPFEPGDELVALYELRNARLISVTPELGRVSATALGLSRLAQWNSWQHGKAS